MTIAPTIEARVGRGLDVACRLLAYGGGLILVSAAIITVMSIIGRALLSYGFGPIRGDFELVEAGCAIAIFAFLPWCQLKRGHVTVDVVVDRLPPRLKALLGCVGDVTVAVVSGLILWRIYLGFGEKFPYFAEPVRGILGMGSAPFFPETTYELEMPVWIPYGLATLGAVLFFIVSVYTVWRSLNWVLAGAEARP